MQGPVTPLARLVGRARHFDKAVVEGETVANEVLPSLLVLAVEGEEIHDELVDFAERAHLVGVVLDRHCYE